MKSCFGHEKTTSKPIWYNTELSEVLIQRQNLLVNFNFTVWNFCAIWHNFWDATTKKKMHNVLFQAKW